MSGSQTRAQAPAPARPWASRWQWPAVVADVDGLYFPETHDVRDVTPLPLPEPLTAGEIADYAADFGVGVDGRDLGQIWVTPRMSDQLGLVIDDELTDAVAAIEDADATQRQKTSRAVFERLTEAGGPVIASLQSCGWEIGNRDTRRNRTWLQPRITLRREADSRALHMIFADYALVWDPNNTGPLRDPMPDPDDEPEQYARELARRLGRLHAVLGGVQWGASSGATGANIADHVRPPSWPREAGPRPPLEHVEQNQLEPTWNHHRRVAGSELDQARWLHSFDGRLSWLTRASTADLGFGQPTHYLGDNAESVLQSWLLGKPTVWPPGVWRVLLPSWDHASLPAPHPLMRPNEPVTRWMTTPSLRLLRDDLDLDVPIVEAWIYPERHRCMDAWAKRLKQALVGDAKAAKDVAERLAKADRAGDEAAAAWWRHRHELLTGGARGAAEHARTAGDLAEAATWDAVAAAAKSIYAVYLQRLASTLTLRAGERYQHHHQWSWPHTVVAEQRRMDYLKIHRHALATGIHPLALVRNDEVFYLSSSPDPASVAPDQDNGALGKLRAKEAPLELTDDLKEQIAREPRHLEVLWDRHRRAAA